MPDESKLVQRVRGALGVQEPDAITGYEGRARFSLAIDDISPWWRRKTQDWEVPASGGTTLSAGGAGIRTEIGLVNPTNSRTWIVCDQIISSTTVNGRVEVVLFASIMGGGGAVSPIKRDLRAPAVLNPTGLVNAQNAAATGGTLGPFYIWRQSSAAIVFPIRVLLAPNQSLIVRPTGDNAGLTASFQWVEWPIEPSLTG